MVGLLATDRMVLLARHRLHAQAVHRAAAFTAVAMLVTHVLSQVLRDRVGIDAFVPFASVESGFGLRLGTVACYLLIVVIGTAVARGRFAASTRPWLWRGLHCAAYVAWPLAIVHGLTSGRTPAGWVTTSYGLCLAAVAFAVIVRFLPKTRRRRQG
jgi:DMSO/TMAO reductase YedYZ heme-binding membrane subunit